MDRQLRGDYTHQGMAHALNIYNFPNDYPSFLQLNALRYLFRIRQQGCIFKELPKIPDLLNKARSLFDTYSRSRNTECMAEIADIVHTYSPYNKNELLDRLRNNPNGIVEQIQDNIQDNVPALKPIKKTVYEDSQNVHNSQVNQTVIKSAENLYERYKNMLQIEDRNFKEDCIENVRTELVKRYKEQKYIINSGIDYIKTNTSIFGSQKLQMMDVFLSVWMFLTPHEHRQELESRLLEELREMHGTCSTGHIARLVNVIQGFTDEENLCIRISSNEQCNAVVKNYLNKELSQCQDEKVIDGIMEGNDDYKNFIRQRIAKKLLEWQKEYGKGMLANIAKIVNEFSHVQVFD